MKKIILIPITISAVVAFLFILFGSSNMKIIFPKEVPVELKGDKDSIVWRMRYNEEPRFALALWSNGKLEITGDTAAAVQYLIMELNRPWIENGTLDTTKEFSRSRSQLRDSAGESLMLLQNPAANFCMGYGAGMDLRRGECNIIVASYDSFAMTVLDTSMVWYVNYQDSILNEYPFIKQLLLKYEEKFISTRMDNIVLRKRLVADIEATFYNTNL